MGNDLPWAQQAYRLFNIIVLKQPTRTWCGALLGIAFVVIDNIASFIIYHNKAQRLYDSDWQLVLFGIFILHVPTAWKLAANKPQFDENIEAALAVLERARADGVSQARLNAAYHELLAKVVSKVAELQTTNAQLTKRQQR